MAHRRFNVGLLMLLSVLAFSSRTHAQEIDAERYARVKAGYVLNFLRLTTWPEQALETEQSPIIIAVVGDDAMTPFLRELIREERIDNRGVILRFLDYPQPRPGEYDVPPETMERFERAIRTAHVLYVGRDQARRLRTILELVEDHPVLTVSDIPRFAESGGMLGLTLRDNRVAIDAHPERMRASGVTVSARVLRLARIVNDGEPTAR